MNDPAPDTTSPSGAWDPAACAPYLAPPTAADHKYSRGVLGLRTGSPAYPGAAVLGAEAAWRTGAGLVQFVPPVGGTAPLFGMPSPAATVLAARPETVVSRSPDRVDAWLVGSGTDPEARPKAETDELAELLTQRRPVIIDAGALDLCLLRRDERFRVAPVAITPHAGEFARLWRALGGSRPTDDAGSLGSAEATAQLAKRLDVTVLLKGSVTTIASPSGDIVTVGPATPWLATAGTGDVLAGIVGTLAARHAGLVRRGGLVGPAGTDWPDWPAGQIGLADRAPVLAELCATAVLLHDIAARIASGDSGGSAGAASSILGRPITALDVARSIPAAVERLLGP
ncbi:hydroxyethylthiazole kinase-like uncharacterized protein yjeF [Leucobacter komagatae]|uniref:ADP-dependent (S)-NAD(P)H-hydrate dehydratase n=1 Tax=Leucobacter komagatae TaxID=55969 RepID=A0A542Y231_9MICO|nr:ADP/ATP-dependent (S)-NAD(P)H-hydrate dehydratase [Leucobacter komagatae]TQL42136.1 hydroxyethylthiazole kinase-like uncharacterized protein yjeF [Leucobacter komagatae]